MHGFARADLIRSWRGKLHNFENFANRLEGPGGNYIPARVFTSIGLKGASKRNEEGNAPSISQTLWEIEGVPCFAAGRPV